jgi:hypothetical protein
MEACLVMKCWSGEIKLQGVNASGHAVRMNVFAMVLNASSNLHTGRGGGWWESACVAAPHIAGAGSMSITHWSPSPAVPECTQPQGVSHRSSTRCPRDVHTAVTSLATDGYLCAHIEPLHLRSCIFADTLRICGPPRWHPATAAGSMSSTTWPTRSPASRWRRTSCSWRAWARLEPSRSCSTAASSMRHTRTSRASRRCMCV